MKTGIDAILKNPTVYLNKNWALVTNDAAYTNTCIHSRVALLQAGFNIKKIFSPEHGIHVQGADGVRQTNQTDILTDLPVISLYGEYWKPDASSLKDVEGVLFDIPDIGCRYYTYLWTMTYVMEACAELNKKLVILDRPNPIGNLPEQAEGPWLDEINCSSFIGRWNIPIVHACTLGELAQYFKKEKFSKLYLEVIKIPDYKRSAALLNQSFTPTSPAIQTLETALLYPGTCLFEGVNINEGRGTEFPFTQFGAPWLNAEKLMAAFNPDFFEGISCSPVKFLAATGPYENEWCEGIKLKVENVAPLKPVRMGIHILQQIASLHANNFSERLYKTYANPSGFKHLDKLLGIKDAFQKMMNRAVISTELSEAWKNKMEGSWIYTK